MTRTLADQALLLVHSRLSALSGWTVRLRRRENTLSFTGVLAHVFLGREDKEARDATSKLCRQEIGVAVFVLAADADPVEDLDPDETGVGNAFRYLDRMCGLAEQTIMAPPAWENLFPGCEGIDVLGRELLPAKESAFLVAAIRLQVQYRQTWNDPTTYDPDFT